MSTLRRYLLRQIIATLLMTAAVFTGVLLLGNVLREILPLLMSQQATFGRVAQAFGLLIPFVAVFALPMGMLTATLLVFGRFSADQELTAARASGVSLLSLISPILILSLFLCAISAVVNLDAGPRSRVAFKKLLFTITANLTTLQLPEGRPITIPGDKPDSSYTISVGKNRRGLLEDVHLLQVKNETNLEMIITAPRGSLKVDSTNQVLFLHLNEARMIYVADDLPMSGDFTFSLDLNSARKSATKKPGISDMTYSELKQELRNIETGLNLPLPINKSATNGIASDKKLAVKKALTDLAVPYRVQIHRRMAFSFACFGFTLVGIPLGIRVHRRETNIGIFIALMLVAVYYGLLIVAESMTSRPEFAPHLLMWLPNFVFQAVGAVLLWRANKGI
ncbi:MAG TPA: LptF/LptG family permease [Candidatus Paceibacterota bacterium]|nr:LptF/LptG family permease [Candidatus Paceibacterota bacterium]